MTKLNNNDEKDTTLNPAIICLCHNEGTDGGMFFMTESYGKPSSFPQEKAYISTDADSYQPGGRISFHVFLVNAMTHQEDSLSNYVYTELI